MSKETNIHTVNCTAFQDQKPGTAGLRKKVAVIRQPHYLETYVQSVFNTLKLPVGSALVLGGDGRFFNPEAIQTIIQIAAANAIGKLVIGKDGLLSTPAASHLIRQQTAAGGFILTASHNPGGPDGDFGIKYNIANGGQAPESMTDAFFAASKVISQYELVQMPPVDISKPGLQHVAGIEILIVDSVTDYTRLLQELFDFDCMADAIKKGLSLQFDALHGITGPYATDIFCRLLGAPNSSVLNATPLPDFGGGHPDPTPVDVPDLYQLALSSESPDLLAASDGDGDRNMILLPGQMVSPGDSLAILLANAKSIPGYRDGIPGVARSMPTSTAVDRVAQHLNIPCFETPTGWRYFCNLLDSGDIGLCGEESFGTGSSHVREKDGLWAVLFWLNLLATTGLSGNQILANHWRQFGRDYYQRYDYFIPDSSQADALFSELKLNAESPLVELEERSLNSIDNFTYTDPIDSSVSTNQGVRLQFNDESRVIYRLSGTGTSGATLRVYLQQLETNAALHAQNPSDVLKPLGLLAASYARIEHYTGLTKPSAII